MVLPREETGSPDPFDSSLAFLCNWPQDLSPSPAGPRVPRGQAGNLQARFISDWHQSPKRWQPGGMFIPKAIGKMCSKLRGGDCAFWWPCLCCTREAGPGWGEEGLWVNPGSSELRAREESKVSSQPIPFCFHLECMLSLSVLHQRDTSVSRHLATKVGPPFHAPASHS